MLLKKCPTIFSDLMTAPDLPSRENKVLVGIFVVALFVNLWAVTFNWKVAFMSGHEFRQAQTAITSYYIDQQSNFSLLYETPILGKPWVSILMEVPIYEWTVVLFSRVTGLPHLLAARWVSALCFYAMLPAICQLLERFGLPRPRRLFVLSLVLTCPVYIYYSRAFLMDSMALMCSAWFVVGFVRTMDERRWSWLLLTTVAGTAAALIKSAVLAAWFIPAVGYGCWMLWSDWQSKAGPAALAKTVLWGLGTVVVALGSLRAWIVYTDPIKAAHDSAWIFTSKNLSQGNWGLFDFKSIFSREVWHYLLDCWEMAIMSRWVVLAGLFTALVLPAVRKPVLLAAGVFILAQMMFPFAYAYQDYYFYICAVFLNVAFGYLLLGVLDSRLPRWAVAVIMVVPFAAQLQAYRANYWIGQNMWSSGGYPFTDALRDLTPKDSVLVVAGADWAAMTPLHAERRALMIRNGLQYDAAYLDKAFGRFAKGEVSAVVVMNEVRTDRNFLERVSREFDLDVAAPAFSWAMADVYIPRAHRQNVQLRIRSTRRYPQLTIPPAPEDALPRKGLVAISEDIGRNAFLGVRPAPYQVQFEYGLSWLERGTETVLSAHPNSDLWVRPPKEATSIRWVYGIFEGAYAKPEAATNGVEFIVNAEMPDGGTRRIYRRVLDPANQPSDRGDQKVTIPYEPRVGEVLRFSTRPNDNTAFDWAYWSEIKVQ